ncbi:ABC transporter permease [Microbispora bryophytorum]|uniref:ABC transporter permease n=1 Tax=Microbispora bryophytorum TaxID=1460882 RepID=UPI0033C27960
MGYAIQADGLAKRYGETRALDGVDLEVPQGRLLGVLGPNGAGKTTAVRILATLVRPDGGGARVSGFDVVRQAHQVRSLIGLTGQYAAVDDALTGVENLVMIGRLLGLTRATRGRVLEVRPIEAAHLDLVRRVVADVLDVTPEVSQGQVTALVRDPAAVPAIVRRLDDLDVVAAELSLRRASLPISRSAPLAGRIVADTLKQVWAFALFLGLGLVLGFRVHTGIAGVLGALALLLAFALAMSWMAVLVGVTAASMEKVQILMFSLMMPITFTSNAFVATDTMPSWLQKWVEVNPVSHLADAVRGLLGGGPVASDATISLLWAAGIAVVVAPLAVRAFRNRI